MENTEEYILALIPDYILPPKCKVINKTTTPAASCAFPQVLWRGGGQVHVGHAQEEECPGSAFNK